MRFREVFRILFVLWVGIVGYAYFRAVPVEPGFLDFFVAGGGQPARFGAFVQLAGYYFKQLAVAILLFASAFGWGRVVGALFRLEHGVRSEEIVFSTGFGFVLLMNFVLLIGWTGVLYAETYLLFIVPGALNALRIGFLERKNFVFLPSFKAHALTTVLEVLMLCSLFVVFITSLAPEIFVDALYYLTLPLMWMRSHAINVDHNTILSFLPSHGIYLYLFGVMLGDGVAAKLIHFGFGLLIVFMLYGWTKSRYGREAAVTASFLYLSIPFVMIVMCRTGMDLQITFFEMLALFSILSYLKADPAARMRWLAAGALFCGTAMNTKYLSAFSFAGLCGILLVYCLRKKVPVRHIVIFVSIVIVLIAPYIVRNSLVTGMPLYPFNISASNDITWMTKGQQVTINEPKQMPRTIVNLIGAPWHIAVQDQSTHEPFSGALLLVLFPLVLLLGRRGGREIRTLLLYAVIFYVCWFMVRTYFRYLLPGLPALCIVLGYLISTVSRDMKKIIAAALIIFGTANILFAVGFMHAHVQPWPVVAGFQTRDEYLSTQRPFYYHHPAYPAVQWVNNNLPDDAKVLFLGDARGYYCTKDFIISGISDPNPIVPLLKGSATDAEFYEKLRDTGITHILLNVPEMIFQRKYDALPLDMHDLAVWDGFWRKHVREIIRVAPDLALPDKGLYSCRKQRPPFWTGYLNNPFNYVYVYELLPEDAALRKSIPPLDFLLSPEVYPPERQKRLIAEMAARS